ncbi:MAG: putative protein tyrosine phosphatase [Cellvibrionaceae bacterium]|jgi:predicted protein tyrosine phosphatase
MMKVLFLCSKNKLRSPTAETILSNVEDWRVYSTGIRNDADVHVSLEDTEWAGHIFVIEKSYKKKHSNKFGPALNKQAVISLDIPDNYEQIDKELIKRLKEKVPSIAH